MAKSARIRAALVFMSAELAKSQRDAGSVVVTEGVVTDPRALVRGGNMNPDGAAGQPPPKHRVARRSVPRGLGAGALTVGVSTGKYPFEMKVADNSLNKAVKIGASLEPANA